MTLPSRHRCQFTFPVGQPDCVNRITLVVLLTNANLLTSLFCFMFQVTLFLAVTSGDVIAYAHAQPDPAPPSDQQINLSLDCLWSFALDQN